MNCTMEGFGKMRKLQLGRTSLNLVGTSSDQFWNWFPSEGVRE